MCRITLTLDARAMSGSHKGWGGAVVMVLALCSYGLAVLQSLAARLAFFGESVSAVSKLQSAAFLVGTVVPAVVATIFAGLLGARAMLILIVVPAGILAGLGFSAWGPTLDTKTGELVRPNAHLLLGGVNWGFTAIIAVVGVVAMFAQRRS